MSIYAQFDEDEEAEEIATNRGWCASPACIRLTQGSFADAVVPHESWSF